MDKDTIVVYSPALKLDKHPELIKATNMGIKIYEYQEMLGKLTKTFDTICISGCHGKTTTTSLLKHLFESTIGCNYFIGDGQGHIDLKNKLLVIESDEFNRHFLAYHPKTAVITCVEL